MSARVCHDKRRGENGKFEESGRVASRAESGKLKTLPLFQTAAPDDD